MRILIQAASNVSFELTLSDTLPDPVTGPLSLEGQYSIVPQDDYYILEFVLKGTIQFMCQRCAGTVTKDIKLENRLAVCPNDKLAERLMATHEPVLMQGRYLDFERVACDELHLAPVYFHPEGHCSLE